MWCKNCNKIIFKFKFCCLACGNTYRAKNYYHSTLKFNKEIIERRKSVFKKWYSENKDRQAKSVLNNYKKNRRKWAERRFVDINRKNIIELMPKKCYLCKKENPSVIHHKNYNLPKREYRFGKLSKGEYLKNYVKFLLIFCSSECHLRFHKKQNI